MAARRLYSDPAVGAIVNNIMQMLNGSPEEALAQAQIAKQVGEVDRMRSQDLARNSLANVFSNYTDPSQIAGSSGAAFGEAFRAGVDPSQVAAALLGYAANAGGSNDVVSRAYVGGGHAMQPNDALTVGRQGEIRADNERQKDEEQRAALANAFAINEANVKATQERFYNAPVNVAPGHTVYQPKADGTREQFVGSPKAGTVGTGAVPLDVAPQDVEKLGAMLDGIIDQRQIPPELRQKVITRASELYGQTRNSRTAMVQALDEIAQIKTTPGMFPWSAEQSSYEARTPQAAAPGVVAPVSPITPEMFAPAVSDGFTQPDVTPQTDPSAALPQGGAPAPDGDGVEGEIQQNKKTGQFRIKRNGNWVPYAPGR